MNPALAIEYVDVSALVPMPGNPRRNEAAIPKVAESIKRFGWTNPILARRADRVVVAGHTRLEAAKRLGSDKVPVIWVDLDPVSSRLYNLADNKLAQIAEWDEPALAAMLEQLKLEDAEGLAIAGFGDEEIARILAETAGGEGSGTGPTLTERFGVPPFSVLDARQGYWQERKQRWLALGIQSELGRGGGDDMERERGRDANLSPGGSMMPAADYSSRKRGDGRGRPVKG